MEDTADVVVPGFTRRETLTIMDGLVVRWQEDRGKSAALEVSASRNGIMVSGYSASYTDVERLHVLLDLAQAEYDRLRT